ncbi:MAG: response regulator [Spirochaetia bacterium]
MRVLVVEDDGKISSFVKKGLEQAGYAVDCVANGEDGYAYLRQTPYDAAIVDIMLPGIDGLTMVQRIREEDVETPIIILSAKRSVEDRIKGIQTGSDDYLTKPFSFSELLARLQALMRRAGRGKSSTRLTYADLTLDLLKHEARRGEQTIELQPREFSLLEYMMRNAGTVLSKTMIMEHVWNYDFDPQTNVVDVLVWRLRKKVDEGYEQKLIHTVRGVGYVLKSG